MKPAIMLASSLLVALVTTSTADASKPPDKPNVLMIIADDLNDWVGCLGGHPDVKTPNIDRLARRGLLFANAHCAAPVCNPSRVATFTGRRPSSTGIYNNAPVWHEVMPGVASIPQHFKASGYYTAGGGKVYHHMPGFNRRSDWNEYCDQVFDGHYQARLARGENVKNFTWPDGFPLNGLPEVKALARPPRNAREFDWGPFDKPDNDMGDGQMVQWAEKFLADQERAQEVAVEQSEAALRLAQSRYEAGLDDVITLLAAQRSAAQAESRLLEVRRLRLDARIDLHLALGGGFERGSPRSEESAS